jgi:hypothetical protein
VAAISIAKIGDPPPPGIGAVVIFIAKQNGLVLLLFAATHRGSGD